MYPSVGGSATVPGLAGAITGQEGSGPNSVSPAGARGTRQVTLGFFQKYAQAGENFNNEADRVAVSDRGINALSQKYNGDAARVAVAYFSGEDNVSPPGSPTPWIQNKNDGRTTVSQYVAGVQSRLKAAPEQKVAGTPYVIGDSLASGIRTAGNYEGNTEVGANPAAVLRSVQAMPDNQVRGRPIVLSGGASNNPAQTGMVYDQVRALQAKGAGPITIVGVGTRQDFQEQEVNTQLQRIATRTGARFVPLPQQGLTDQVHPADYSSLATSVADASGCKPEYASSLSTNAITGAWTGARPSYSRSLLR